MALSGKDTSWWNEKVKRTIKNKRICHRNLSKSRDTVSFENYKLAKKEAKKTVKEAKTKVYQDTLLLGLVVLDNTSVSTRMWDLCLIRRT